MNDQHVETAKHIGDVISIVIALGALAQWLPPISALFAIVYTGIRIFESRTVQRMLKRELD